MHGTVVQIPELLLSWHLHISHKSPVTMPAVSSVGTSQSLLSTMNSTADMESDGSDKDLCINCHMSAQKTLRK